MPRGADRRYTLGHSPAVADLAVAAGLVLGLGRLGIANTIWDKRGPVTAKTVAGPVEVDIARNFLAGRLHNGIDHGHSTGYEWTLTK